MVGREPKFRRSGRPPPDRDRSLLAGSGRTRKSRAVPRPVAPTRAFLALSAMAVVVFVIGRGTGSTWLALLASSLVATLLLSAFLPLLALSGVDVALRTPLDGTVGVPLEVDVHVRGRLWDSRLRVGGHRSSCSPLGPWTRVEGTGWGPMMLVADRRGIHRELAVEIRSAAPLGLVWWRLGLTVFLASPLEVGPRPLPMARPTSATPVGDVDAPSAAAAPPLRSPLGDAVRTVREYTPGDAMKSVSWSATARHGRLLVKEMDEERQEDLTIVVDLRGAESAAEEAAGRAAGLANVALAEGVSVTLVTVELGGVREARVYTGRDVGRRLARAVGGAAPPARAAEDGSVWVRALP